MKYVVPTLALASALMLSADASADPPGGKGGKGEKGAAGQRAFGRPGKGGDGIDINQFATRAIEQFDRDGDDKLNLRELTAFMTAMRERRMGAGQGRPQLGKDGQQRPGVRNGKQRRPGNDDAPAGGEKPRRPKLEE